jgi:hypothetical protein
MDLRYLPRHPHKSRRAIQLLALAVVAAVALAVAACSSSSGTGSTPGGTGSTPTATSAPPTPTTGATATPTTGATATPSGYPVKVYFSKHPESDSNPAAVFPVNRVSPTLQVATYASAQLIAGPTASEHSAGYYTPLTSVLTGSSNCGGPDFQITLNMKGSTPEAGTATFKFCRATSLPGDLTGGVIRAEINKTLLQFSTIHKVVILDSTGHCFDDLSGLNACLS